MHVLVTGLGSIARKHIAALRDIDPGVRITALRSHPGAAPFPGVTDIHDLSQLDGTPTFAIVSNPTALHARTIESLLPLGIPLMIEKPVVDRADDHALMLAGRARSLGITTYVACNLRYLPSLQWLKASLDNGTRRLNEVNVYCGSYLPDWRPGTDWRNSYSARPDLGGGVNIDLIHDIDYTCWLLGMPLGHRGICRNVSSLGISAWDWARFDLLYPGFTATVTLNYFRRDYRRDIELVFDDTTWTLDIARDRITDHRGNTVFDGGSSIARTYRTQMQYFIDAVNNRTHPDNDMHHALQVLQICNTYDRPDT